MFGGSLRGLAHTSYLAIARDVYRPTLRRFRPLGSIELTGRTQVAGRARAGLSSRSFSEGGSPRGTSGGKAGDETRTRDIFLGKENPMFVEQLKYLIYNTLPITIYQSLYSSSIFSTTQYLIPS
jgi:hypothetical protein